MTPARAARLARVPWIGFLLLMLPAMWLTWLNRSLIPMLDWVVIPIVVAGFAAFATIGMVVSARHPGNAIGWVFQLFPLLLLGSILAGEYANRALVTAPGSFPGGAWALWLNAWLTIPAVCLLPLSFLLFPDGALPSRSWRIIVWALVTSGALTTIGLALGGTLETGAGTQITNPAAVGPGHLFDVLSEVGAYGILAAVVGSAAGLIVRFRRSEGIERQQIRWLAYAVSVSATLFLTLLVYVTLGGGDQSVTGTILWLGWVMTLSIGIPAAAAVAILRYRLYDLDVVIKKTVVVAIVAAFITLAYVLIVVAIPTVLVGAGGTSRFSPLVLLTTIVVALLIQPVRVRARRLADRLVYGKRATPYEVLSEFSDRLADAYSTDDVLPRMAQLVGTSTGATEAQVWLRVGGELFPVAVWPSDGPPASPVGMEGDDLPLPGAFPVRHQGELLGAITVLMPANDPMNPSKERLVNDVAGQAGLVLRNVRLIEEVRASRRRIVAAQDERAKKLERDIHDGAQQQLVALAVKQRLAASLVGRDDARAAALLGELQAETSDALENLRDLARGIYPPVLADEGLAAALEAQARKAPIAVEVRSSDPLGRYPQEIESAVYFCTLEALQNIAKYARATTATITFAVTNGELRFEIRDDGVGFDPATTRGGTGLQGMVDRVEAIGGSLEVGSTRGEGTTITGRVPLA